MTDERRHEEMTHEVELPCGIVTPEGKIERRAELLPMTGRVRKNIARPEVRSSGARIVDTVLLACVKAVGARRMDRALLDELLVADRDFLTLKVRQISLGRLVEGRMNCAGCREPVRFEMDLEALEVYRLDEGRYELAADGRTRLFRLECETQGVSAVFRFPAGADQRAVLPLAQKNPVEAGYRLYGLCLDEWNGKQKPFPATFFEDMPLALLDWLDAEFSARMPGPELRHEVICDLCGARGPVNLEASNFLFPSPAERNTRQRP